MSLFKPIPKIIQHDGKRFSLRLEGVFWAALKDIADAKHIKPGALVALLAEKCEGINFSSFVRAYCMAETGKMLVPGSAGRDAVTLLFETSPSPGVIINRRGIIVTANSSFRKWFGADEEAFINRDFTEIFGFIHSVRPLGEIISSVTGINHEKTTAPVFYTTADGKKINSLISFADITLQENDAVRIAVWFNTQPAVRIRIQ